MLGSGTERHGRQHKRLYRVVFFQFIGSGPADLLGEPGIEIHRQVRALLLGAARGNDGQPALFSAIPDFLVGQITELHGVLFPLSPFLIHRISSARRISFIRLRYSPGFRITSPA